MQTLHLNAPATLLHFLSITTALNSIFSFESLLNNSSMASTHQVTIFTLLIFILSSSLQIMLVSSFEFQVGGKMGWSVPSSNETKVYNDWASEKRFKVGDSIRFKYRKDSVMEVSEAEYNKCNSTHPLFFSNTGNTIFSLDRSGDFYFISGASGHCDKGQRMIVKVLAHDDPHHSPSSSSASGKSTLAVFTNIFLALLIPMATLHFFFFFFLSY